MNFRQLQRRNSYETAFLVFVVAGTIFYLSLFGFNSLTRTRQFSPDSMNYVDVARNIANGKGIVQSTLGFNQALLFEPDSPIPTPLTSQPPLYPLLIFSLSRFGVSYADAALVIPVIAYGFILLLGFWLARDLYGLRTALLSLAGLLLYSPLSYVSRFAWTEPVGLAMLFLCFLFLLRSCRFTRIPPLAINSFLAGVAAGLAFSTRYVLLAAVLLGILFLIAEHRGWKSRLAAVLLFVAGAGLPVAAILVHNRLSAGQIMPAALASDSPLLTNLRDAFYFTFGNFLREGGALVQATLALIVAGLTVIVLSRERRAGELVNVLIAERRYLLTLWFLLYSALVIFQRTIQNFDSLETRIMVPAGIVLVLLGAALITRVIEPKISNKYAYYSVVVLAILVGGLREIGFAVSRPSVSPDQNIYQSERLRWIDENTTDQDLIIGEGTVDLPFYFGRQAAVAFSVYPYNIRLTYDTLLDFADQNCSRYERIYLVLRNDDGQNYDRLVYGYGQFIADLKSGHAANYPALVPTARLKDATVFQILCRPSG